MSKLRKLTCVYYKPPRIVYIDLSNVSGVEIITSQLEHVAGSDSAMPLVRSTERYIQAIVLLLAEGRMAFEYTTRSDDQTSAANLLRRLGLAFAPSV